MPPRGHLRTNRIPGERAAPNSLNIPGFDYNFWSREGGHWLLDDDHLRKHRSHSTRIIAPSRYIDQNYLQSQGIEEEVMLMLRGIGWDQVLSTPRKTYRGLTLEFYSTYREYKVKGHVTAISFQMCGKQLWMPVKQIAQILGFNSSWRSDEDQIKKDYCFSLREEWEKLGIDASRVYKVPRATMLTRLAHKYIHRLLTTTICGRGDSTGNVGAGDCFLLFCMSRRIKLDGTAWVLRLFSRISTTGTGKICGGGFVTALALGLGFKEDSDELTPMPEFLLGADIMRRVKDISDPKAKGKGKRVVEESEEEEEESEGESEEMEEEIGVEEKRQVLSIDGVNVYTKLRRARSIPIDLSERARNRIMEARKKKKSAVGFLKSMAKWIKNMWNEADKDEVQELERYEWKKERRSKREADHGAGPSNR